MTALTRGCHHIGLTVTDLEASAGFFTALLGWKEVRRDDSYPAIFVTDGTVMVTLWQSRSAEPATFNKDAVGLHHIAFMVDDENTLNDCYRKISEAGLEIEFAPEYLREGPARHMICYEPSGIRVELIWPAT